MKVREFFHDESRWIKHGFLKQDEKGWKACLIGAIELCYREKEVPGVIKKVRHYLLSEESYYSYLEDWNDLPATKFKQIQKLIKTLDI